MSYRFIVKHPDTGESVAFDQPIAAWAYETARSVFNKSQKQAERIAALAEDMWLHDSNETPVGQLCDYVSRHYPRLNKLSNVYKQLSDFYENYETDDIDDFSGTSYLSMFTREGKRKGD